MSQAGWYPDPSDGNQQRYWDGTNWTEHRSPAASASTPSAAAPVPYGATPSVPYGTAEATPYPGYYAGASRTTSGKAITSLVLGILGLISCGFLTGIPAMFVAHAAIREIDASGGQIDGRALATAGFWTGLIATVLYGLLFAFLVVAFAVGVSEG